MKCIPRACVRAVLRLAWLGRRDAVPLHDAEGMRAFVSDPSGGTGDERHQEIECGVEGSSGLRQRFGRITQKWVRFASRSTLGEYRKGSPSARAATPQGKGVVSWS